MQRSRPSRLLCAVIAFTVSLSPAPIAASEIFSPSLLISSPSADEIERLSGGCASDGEYGGWVELPATVGLWFFQGIGLPLGIAAGAVSLPGWFGFCAAGFSTRCRNTGDALQMSVLTGLATYGATAAGGYLMVGSPLSGSRHFLGLDPEPCHAPLPPEKLRPLDPADH